MAEQCRSERAQHGFWLLVEAGRLLERGLPEADADRQVLATLAGKAITAHSYLKRLLNRAIAAERAGAGVPPILGWVFQDFRRAGVTTLAGAGFPPHVPDKLLNPVQGTIRGVAAIYQRGEFAEERRRALDAWAAHVLRRGEGETLAGNVVLLAERAA